MGEYLSSPITEKSIADGENSKLKFGACGMQGWRKNMEDTHIAEVNFAPDTSLFAVFDGHGGQEAAAFVARHFGDELKKTPAFKKGDYKQALIDTFLAMDSLMDSLEGKKELSEISNSLSKATSIFGKPENDDIAFYVGCTACVVLIAQGYIYVANAGDSRSILSKNGHANALSEDHKPELERERKRIEKAKGFVEDNRVNGILNLSRSLGDLEYKRNKGLKSDEQMITALPDVKIEKITNDIDFILIACDGIWDCLTNQQAADYVLERLSKQAFKSERNFKLSKILENMFDKIIANDVASSGGVGCDNMTSVIITLKK